MTKVLLTVRIEETTKTELHTFAKDLNMTVSALVCALVKQSVRDRRLFLTTRARGSYRTIPLNSDLTDD